VFVPLKVRGQSLGVLRLRKPDEAGRWTVEDFALLETMVEQLGMALESARLYQDTQRMATRERLVGEIAGKLRATLDPDAILKATVRELGRALGAAQAVVEITGPLSEGKED
jgi:GAF domain-containing protein